MTTIQKYKNIFHIFLTYVILFLLFMKKGDTSMKTSTATIFGIVVCDLIVTPIVYYKTRSILISLIVAVVIAVAIIIMMRKGMKAGAAFEEAFKSQHPDESVLTCQPATNLVEGVKSEGSLIVTNLGVYYLTADEAGIVENKIEWEKIRSYQVAGTLDLFLQTNDVVSFGILNADKITIELDKYISKEYKEVN